MAISKLNPSAGGIPFGNTAGRPTAATGKLYSNGETARLELYTSGGAWENIVQEVPGVASIGGQYLETNNSNTITIYGTNFVSGASAFAIGTNAVEVAATSTTFNSLVQLSAVFTGLTAANEPYDIKVVNPSNLFSILPDSLFVNNQVTWTTSAGSLGNFAEQVAISVSAVAADDSTITYAVASGSTLPSGIILNTATGLLSGTLADVVSNTTYTFTLTASDGSNPAVSRQFSILANAAPVWSTSAGSLGTFSDNSSISISLAATDASDSVSYALASGSTLPTGVTLNSSTGVISGTLPDVATNTTYTFTVNASDAINTVGRTFSITSNNVALIEYLVIAGGGGGAGGQGGMGVGGGGGAGGYRSSVLGENTGGGLSAESKFAASFGTAYTVSVGNGGSGASAGNLPTNGESSTFASIVSLGGGFGGRPSADAARTVGSGGSGGGLGQSGTGTGTGTSGQGYNGGIYGGVPSGSGGGGAGAQGSDGVSGAGGVGVASSITGSSVFRAGGGGGGRHINQGGVASGGNGGGGNSGPTNGNGVAGSTNTGGGGGGGGESSGTFSGGNGGSGVVIIKYANTLSPTISAGLTSSTSTAVSGYKVTTFTAGSGTVTF
jgi:hypothetical protein